MMVKIRCPIAAAATASRGSTKKKTSAVLSPNSCGSEVLASAAAAGAKDSCAAVDESFCCGGDVVDLKDEEYLRAVEVLRDFHHRRARTLDVIYEEGGRDLVASSSSGGRIGGGATDGASRMFKVRTTGSLLDLLVEADPEPQQRPTPSGGDSDSTITTAAGSEEMGEWGHFDPDGVDASSGPSESDAAAQRLLHELALHRIGQQSLTSRHHHPPPRYRPRRPCNHQYRPTTATSRHMGNGHPPTDVGQAL